jgi:hypothetical protein
VSVQETTGVSGVARILSRLSDGAPRTVTELAEETGLARATAFDIVRRLQNAQIVAREATGKIIPGPAAIALSFSRFSLKRLHGPAEALLRWLRDHCDATAALTCMADGERMPLASFAANWAGSTSGGRPQTLSYPICAESGMEVARLEVICRPDCSRSESAEIGLLATRAKVSLEHYLCETT